MICRNLTKTVMLSVMLLLIGNLSAQNPARPHTIIGKRLFVDHYSPAQNEFSDFDNFTAGFELGYLRNLNKYVNAVIPVKIGVLKIPEERDNFTFVGADFVGQLQYYENDKQFIIPYGLLGLGGVVEDFNAIDFQVPIGLGLNVRLGKYGYINFQAEYRKSLARDRSNIQYGVGLAFMLGKIPDEILPEPLEIPLVDTDKDGVADAEDSCPTIAGLAAFNGCPDTDKDGITDAEDNCPKVAGLAAFQGCPDTDGDKIIDKDDQCPNEAGTAKYNGCPPSDSDNDGFNDEVDECPNEAGTLRGCPDSDGDGIVDSKDDCPFAAGEGRFNGCPDTDKDGIPDQKDRCPNSAAPNSPTGCPEITKEDKAVLDYALQAVQFETGKSTLKTESSIVLDQVISVLNRYPDFHLEIIGHTDDVGTEDNNLRLSQRRAKACFDYLLTKGVPDNRMSYGGFGENNPIASNDTPTGRRLNRRVEFVLAPK